MTDQMKLSQQSPPRPGSIKWFLVIPVVLCLCGAVVINLRIQRETALVHATQALDIEPVSVVHAQRGAGNTDLALPGTLEAYSDAPVFARVDGYVSHWYTDIGAHVRQGQLLALIDSPTVDQELNQARAMLAQTRATMKLARITAERYRELIKTDAVSQQDVDQTSQNLEAQTASVQAASANVDRLEQMQGFEKVVAPFDGIITQRRTDIGHLINAGNGGMEYELFRMSKIDVVRVYVTIPEIYSESIANGMRATLSLTELPNQSFNGAVVRSTHAIATDSHTLEVEIDVPNPTGALMPGAYAEVHIHPAVATPALIIPSEAVLYQAAGPQVAVVTQSNQVELHKVSLGRDFGNTIEITGGITDRDSIIAMPPDYLVDGMKVSVQPPSGEATT